MPPTLRSCNDPAGAVMPDELLQRLRRFREDAFPHYRVQFQALVDEGQHPTETCPILFV